MRLLLDVTRLVSRIGQSQLTGVDRVERAYLDHVLGLPDPLFLYRSTRGYVLLGAEGGRALARFADGADLPRFGDFLSFLIWRGLHPRHRLQAALRRYALARVPHFMGLSDMIARHVPEDAVYLNVGHSNLAQTVFDAVKPRRIFAYIHDVIPLSHPEYARPKAIPRFATKLTQLGAVADAILTNSEVSKQAICDWYDASRAPPCHVLYPGLIDRPKPQISANQKPRFLMIGTIEPRKNHGLILDIWADLARDLPSSELPELHIVGQRGWADPAVFERLEHDPLRNRVIFEHGPLSDDVLWDMMQGNDVLLFPSFVEGFGYPPLEALQAGMTCLVSDIPVHREILKTSAIFLSPLDPQPWKTQIKDIMLNGSVGLASPMDDIPNWKDHFRALTAVISE